MITHFKINDKVLSVSLLQVALLSGPPGLGKTTLAHVIARHAGYNVVEINARYLPYPSVFEKEFTICLMLMFVYYSQRPKPVKSLCLVVEMTAD